jgi:hypothetical protein
LAKHSFMLESGIFRKIKENRRVTLSFLSFGD